MQVELFTVEIMQSAWADDLELEKFLNIASTELFHFPLAKMYINCSHVVLI